MVFTKFFVRGLALRYDVLELGSFMNVMQGYDGKGGVKCNMFSGTYHDVICEQPQIQSSRYLQCSVAFSSLIGLD